jgi:hypothetical protein
MSTDTTFEISTGLTILPPKSGQAYPIPCVEWQMLKQKINAATTDPWFFHTLGSALVGSSLSAIIAILLGTFSSDSQQEVRIVAWATFFVTGISGSFSLIFAGQQRKLHHDRNSDIIAQMELIEKRFDQPEA